MLSRFCNNITSNLKILGSESPGDEIIVIVTKNSFLEKVLETKAERITLYLRWWSSIIVFISRKKRQNYHLELREGWKTWCICEFEVNCLSNVKVILWCGLAFVSIGFVFSFPDVLLCKISKNTTIFG